MVWGLIESTEVMVMAKIYLIEPKKMKYDFIFDHFRLQMKLN